MKYWWVNHNQTFAQERGERPAMPTWRSWIAPRRWCLAMWIGGQQWNTRTRRGGYTTPSSKRRCWANADSLERRSRQWRSGMGWTRTWCVSGWRVGESSGQACWDLGVRCRRRRQHPWPRATRRRWSMPSS